MNHAISYLNKKYKTVQRVSEWIWNRYVLGLQKISSVEVENRNPFKRCQHYYNSKYFTDKVDFSVLVLALRIDTLPS